LNRADMIETAIKSVIDQHYDSFEHIIIDGGSKDDTLKVLEKYPHLRVISEPDRGVYDAMNKGIHLAKGDIVGLLNSDDYYEKGCFSKVTNDFICNNEALAVAGCARVIQKDISNVSKEEIKNYPSSVLNNLLHAASFGVPLTNAWFWRKSVFDTLGGFDLKYKLVADRDFILRVYKAGIKYYLSSAIFYNYLFHADSMTITHHQLRQLKLIKDSIGLAQAYLDDSCESVRRECKDWYIFLVGEMIKIAWRLGDKKTSLKYLTKIIMSKPLWVFPLVKNNLHVLKHIPEILKAEK